ncbi:MAG TPA: hypothetical protein VGI76_00305 [Solirubrobacteraceae bacterium]
MSLRRLSLGRALAALLLPLSMAPVLLLAPSLLRAPAVLVRHAAHALAPAHHKVHHIPPEGPSYFLVGPARFEIEAMEGAAGDFTPKVGVSPLNEPEWAARVAAAGVEHRDPLVLLARGRELTTASGEPLRATPPIMGRSARAQAAHPSTSRRAKR